MAECLDSKQRFEFNSQRGLETYIDPFTELFCVSINNSPEVGEYFLTNSSLQSNEEVQRLTTEPTKMGFVKTVFKPYAVNEGQLTYTIGDKMKTLVKGDGSTQSQRFQYGNGFPLPKPDSFGVCDNFKSAHFMLDDESSCMQMVDLETACATTLNAEFYSTKLQIMMGRRSSLISNKDFTLGDVYSLDDATMEYTKLTTTDVAALAS